MINKHISYLWYLTKHRYFVMIECFKHGMFWRGIKHDMSKYHPIEFFPYVQTFFEKNNAKKLIRDKTGYYSPNKVKNIKFLRAWNHHVHHNDHHWQHWVNITDENGISIPLEMPDASVKEMICDWIGAGKAQKNSTSTREWFEKNRYSMFLHEKTIEKIEYYIEKMV